QIGAIASGSGQMAQGVNLALTSIFMEFSQADEFEADKLGLKYAEKAGYNPKDMAEMLKKLKAKQDKEPLRPYSYLRTHPFIPQRIANVNR
ncbi:M48 family metalloprotease, partial [Escherichia coli]|uniref:M48 family metalloprotease n=1 Tax=Escherichia coli TaxID=562 RepID=UPI0019327ED4